MFRQLDLFPKNYIFWDVMSCRSVRTDVSEGSIAFGIMVTRMSGLGTTLTVTSNRFLRSVLLLLVTANVVPTTPIHVTLKIEALHSSETSVLTMAERRNIPEYDILQYQS
jgi:hypothetical protein